MEKGSRTKVAMYYMYLLKSTKTREIYLGYTNNLRKRVLEHNTDKSFSTKGKGVWKLIYYEAYKRKEDAITREKRLKFYGQALFQLKRRLNKSLL